MKRYLYGGSGGGSSALLINGTPVAVAGGGGGAGIRTQPGTNNMPSGNKYYNPKAVDAGTTRLGETQVQSVLPAGASASAATGDSAETSISHYTVLKPYTTDGTAMKVAGGNGGGDGQGGAGGEQPKLYDLANVYGVLGFKSQNKQELFSSATAGDRGGSGFDGKGADGVFAYSYQIDNNDISKLEIVHATNPVNLKDTTSLKEEATRKSFNGYQTVVSAGGGAGYGGGGSGASSSSSAIVLTQKWNNNPKGLRQNVSFGQLGGGGGAGGSYVAPGVSGGTITSAGNAPTARSTRGNGYVKVTLCKRTA